MKIERFEVLGVRVNHRGDWLFVRLVSDTGHVGLGEVSHSGDDRAVSRLLATRVAPFLRGRELAAVGPLLRELRSELGSSSGAERIVATALSGTEHALWDAFARRLELPVHALFGGALRRSVPLYANVNRAIVDRSPAGFARAASGAVRDGFRAVKIAPFDGLDARSGAPVLLERALAQGVARVRAVREAIGDDVALMVDCHGRFNRALALEAARRLEPFALWWLEDLIWREDDPGALAALAQRIAQPLAGGEEELERQGYWQLLASASVSTILPDVKHVGGLSEAKKIAELAEAARVWVSPHNPAGPVATRVSAELAATLPNLGHLEYAWGEVDFRATLLEPAERIVEGSLELPEAPGYGVALAEGVLQRHGFDPLA